MRRHSIVSRALPTAIGFLLSLATAVAGQTTDNLLLVINGESADSVRVGEYYASRRLVPESRIVRIRTATTETVERNEYVRTIETPLGQFLVKSDLQDRILYIVLTKGVPLRVVPPRDSGDAKNTVVASVDSELTLLYRRLVGQPVPLLGKVPNPYFLDSRAVSEAKPFSRFVADIYLVTRLDGFTVEDVIGLIDRGNSANTDGPIVLDQRGDVVDAGGDRWLHEAAERVEAVSANRAALESSRALAPNPGLPILGYYSWGTNDSANRLRRFGFRFSPGAIGGMFVSTDGRTMAEPPPDWAPSDTSERGKPFNGSPQSLAADLVRDGITGVSAHVAEPFLDATVRPQILFPAYLSGFNLAEAFYLGMPYLSWQTVVIGDPLCAPFRRAAVTTEQLHEGQEPETGLPALYAERRLAAVGRTDFNAGALKLLFQADAERLRGNLKALEDVLEKATALEPRLIAAHAGLAEIYDGSGRHDLAIERYRIVVATQPEDVVALNNLAYTLAVHKGAAREALPLAERAYKTSNDAPVVADTLGWIHYLLRDPTAAAPLIERALQAYPRNAEILLHAAFVHAALGDLRAATELDAATQIDPKLADREDVVKLREKLR